MWIWELDHKEGWVPKNWCFQIVVLEKTLESPLDYREMKTGNPKGNQPWIFIRRNDAEAAAPIFWPPDVKSWLIGKDCDARKDRRQEEKGTTEYDMVGWHHWHSEHEVQQVPGDGEGQGRLAWCHPWAHKESDTTEQWKQAAGGLTPPSALKRGLELVLMLLFDSNFWTLHSQLITLWQFRVDSEGTYTWIHSPPNYFPIQAAT